MVKKAPRQCFGDFHFPPFSPPTCPLRPVIPNNTCPPRITAAAGTELAGASSSSPVMIETRRKSLTSDSALLHPRDIAGSGVSPLSNIPHCCPPRESGPCLSPSVADHPKRPAKHHWLGQPLPDQLPNTTQAHQTALLSFLQDLARTVRQIPTRYAPVRHFVLNYSDSSKRRPLGQSRSARPVVLKQGETTLARSLFSFCPAPRKQRSTCMC